MKLITKDLKNLNRNISLPVRTVERLLIYKSILTQLDKQKKKYILSNEMEKFTHYKQDLIRRDIMSIGFKGSRAYGYEIKELIEQITEVLKLNIRIDVGLIGAGRIGSALLSYFKENNTRFHIKAVFDKNTDKVTGCNYIYNIDKLNDVIEKFKISYIILAVPPKQAESIVSILNDCDIKGILNFTDSTIKVREGIVVNNIDILMEMEKLAFYSH